METEEGVRRLPVLHYPSTEGGYSFYVGGSGVMWDLGEQEEALDRSVQVRIEPREVSGSHLEPGVAWEECGIDDDIEVIRSLQDLEGSTNQVVSVTILSREVPKPALQNHGRAVDESADIRSPEVLVINQDFRERDTTWVKERGATEEERDEGVAASDHLVEVLRGREDTKVPVSTIVVKHDGREGRLPPVSLHLRWGE